MKMHQILDHCGKSRCDDATMGPEPTFSTIDDDGVDGDEDGVVGEDERAYDNDGDVGEGKDEWEKFHRKS